jgi:hypothetical protein
VPAPEEGLAAAVEAHGILLLEGAEQAVLRDEGRGRSRHELVLALVSQGHCRALRGRPADAISGYLRALDLLKTLQTEEPADPTYRDELAGMYRLSAAALRAAGRQAEALTLEQDAARSH